MDEWKLEPARDLGLPMGQRLRSTRREGGLIDTCAQLAARTMVQSYLRVWHRVEHQGRENIPGEFPFVMVANHSSHLDSVVMAAMVPWRIRKRMFPIAAGDVFFETPIIAAFAAGIVNALPLWRHRVGRHALDDLRARLVEDRCAYILFPEGRRSPDGALLPFKSGLGMLVAGTRVPVVPCFIRGAHLALARDKRWPRPVKIGITVGRPLVFDAVGNDRAGWETVGAEVEGAVRGLGALDRDGG